MSRLESSDDTARVVLRKEWQVNEVAADSTTAEALIERYDAFLLDAYGVLVTEGGVVAGAAEFLDQLDEAGKPWVVCTNDASKLPETSATRYGEMLGRVIEPERVVTSGSLLAAWAEQHEWAGALACVLGPEDSREYARRAGLRVVGPKGADDAEVFVLGDESGFDLSSGLDAALTALIRRIEKGCSFGLVCPNEDVIYPKDGGGFGVAAGGFAGLLESCLDVRFPGQKYRFERLGKPRPGLFQEGLRRLGAPIEGPLGMPSTSGVVMIGDTPSTDVRGANQIRLDVALFGDAKPDRQKREETPTWRLSSW